MPLGRWGLPTLTSVSLLILTGCNGDWGRPPGLSRTDNRSIELDKSEMVHVDVKMGAGELHVRGGAPKLMDAEFTYNRLRMRPQVHYDGTGFRGHLTVEEPPGMHAGNSRYRWDLSFNNDKPLDLNVDFG